MVKKEILSHTESKNGGRVNLLVKGFIWPFLVFIFVLILFQIFSKFNFKIGLLIMFISLLIVFAKKTEFLFYVFIISLPFTSSRLAFRMGFNFDVTYFFFLLVLTSFIYNKFRSGDYSFVITLLDAPLFLFLIVAVISVFQTVYVSSTPSIIRDIFINYPWIEGFLAVIFLLLMFAVYYMTVDIVRERRTFKNALLLLIITATIVSLYGLIGFCYTFITSSHLPQIIDPLVHITSSESIRILAVSSEPLFLGSYILSMLPVLYCLIISRTKYLNRHFLIIASLILTITLFLTVSRGAWFGYSVFLILFIIFYWKSTLRDMSKKLIKVLFTGYSLLAFYWKSTLRDMSKKLIKVLFIAFLLLVIFLLVDSVMLKIDMKEKTNAANKSFSERTIRFVRYASVPFKYLSDNTLGPIIGSFTPGSDRFWSTKIRAWGFKYAWDGFVQHPLLGIGYANYKFYSGHKVYTGLFMGAINFPEVNNYPLKILAEMGLIGFMAFGWLAVKIIKSIVSAMIHEKNSTKKTLITGYLLSFIAVSAQMLFFSYITMAYLWVMLAMIMSLCGIKVINLKEN